MTPHTTRSRSVTSLARKGHKKGHKQGTKSSRSLSSSIGKLTSKERKRHHEKRQAKRKMLGLPEEDYSPERALKVERDYEGRLVLPAIRSPISQRARIGMEWD